MTRPMIRAAALVLMAVLATACARKNDPLPPPGTPADVTPEARAPSVVTDPIRDARKL